MDNVLKTRTLTAAINKIKTVKTPVLDTVFGYVTPKRQLSGRMAFDVKYSNERLLKNIKVSAPAQVTDKTGRKTVTLEAPRFAEKRFISAGDLDEMRRFGDLGPELIKDRVATEQADMKGTMDRTREFMAVKALSGQVVDESGEVLIDYNFSGAQKPVLASTDKWNADADPVEYLEAWKKIISSEVSVDKFHAFCGSGVMTALRNNPKVQEWLKYTLGSQIATTGKIGYLADVTIDVYTGSYIDSSGNRQEFIPDNVFILVGIGHDVAAELYAPVVDLKADGGVGSGKLADMFFSKAWDVEDPSGKWIKAEARPLPVLFQPGAVVYATVI